MPVNVIQSANAARCQEGVRFGLEKEAGSDGGVFGGRLLQSRERWWEREDSADLADA